MTTTATIAPPTNLTNHADEPPVVVQQPLDKTAPNRYQKRKHDAESVASLAENIREHGLKQIPVGRWSPERPGVVELADGHRRRAAFQLLAKTDKRFARMPVQILPLTDKELYETCVITNEQREPLSAIERAISLRDYIAEFGVSQTVAGKLFSLGQTAVAKLVHLLDLPDGVQALVDAGELAEAPARALCTLLEWQAPNDPDYGRQMVIQIANQAIKDHPSDTSKRASRVEFLIDQALRQGETAPVGNDYYRPWPLEWPGAPITVPMGLMLKSRTAPAEVPACKGCPFNLKRGDDRTCLRPACFDTKFGLWTQHQVELASERLGIPAAAEGETVHLILPSPDRYDYDRYQKAVRIMAANPKGGGSSLPVLRLVGREREQNRAGHSVAGYKGDDYGLQSTLGSVAVALATTDRAAVAKYLGTPKAGKAAKPLITKSANETPAQLARRINAEKELKEEKALERMAYNRGKADVLWLVDHTAEIIARESVAAGGLLQLADHLAFRFFNIGLDEMRAANDALAKRADAKLHKYQRILEGWSAEETVTEEIEQLRRQLVAYIVLASEVGGYDKPTDVYGDFKKARDTAEKVATRWFGVELPAGWDTPPVHHTALNCWTCGRFSSAGAGKLTKGDDREGWRAIFANKAGQIAGVGGTLAGVWCPQHASAGIAEWTRATLKARAAAEDAELAKAESKLAKAAKPEIPAKPATKKPKPAPARAGYGRSHSKPASKPAARHTATVSGKKGTGRGKVARKGSK